MVQATLVIVTKDDWRMAPPSARSTVPEYERSLVSVRPPWEKKEAY